MANALLDPYANLRSKRDLAASYVLFFNSTTRPLDLYWVNYEGEHVLYRTIYPNESYDLMTYVTHPWIFRDHDTGNKLLTLPDRRYVYHPRVNLPEGIPRAVVIGSPVQSLKDLSIQACLQIIQDNQQFGKQFICSLPGTLQDELENAVDSAADYRENRPDPDPPDDDD